jgi:hypothetical protein
MSSIRANFFWQGAEDSRKYHMAKWDSLTRPKDQGGLGITNTLMMNECLIVKWIWKLCQGSDELWYKLLQAKYMHRNNFFLSKNKGVSQFWQGLHQVKHLFQWGAMNKIKNGEGTLFWKDIWMGKVPIKLKYPRFFDICRDKDVPVSECYERGEWNIDLVRPLNDSDCCLWEELHTELREHNTSHGSDLVFWALDNSSRFTTKSLYRFRTDGGVKSPVYKKIWYCKVPLKIKVFLWQIYNGKIQAAAVLEKKGWKGSTLCSLCGDKETVDHIFIHCVLSKFVWGRLKNFAGWDLVPRSVASMFSNWRVGTSQAACTFHLFIVAGLVWSLWCNRNKMAITKKFPNSSTTIIYEIMSFLQSWSVLLKTKDQAMLEDILDSMKNWLREQHSVEENCSDIGVI